MTVWHHGPNLTDSVQCKRTVELIPPTTLSFENLQSYPGFCMELHDFLNANGANLFEQLSRKIVIQLSYILCVDAYKRAVASELAKEFLSWGIRRNPKPDTSNRNKNKIENIPHKFTESPKNIAHNVDMRLKDSESKFSGKLENFWAGYVDSYN